MPAIRPYLLIKKIRNILQTKNDVSKPIILKWIKTSLKIIINNVDKHEKKMQAK